MDKTHIKLDLRDLQALVGVFAELDLRRPRDEAIQEFVVDAFLHLHEAERTGTARLSMVPAARHPSVRHAVPTLRPSASSSSSSSSSSPPAHP